MPSAIFEMEEVEGFVADDDIVVQDRVAHLRRNFVKAQPEKALAASALLRTRTHRAETLSEVFSLAPVVDVLGTSPDGALPAVYFQLSNDEGATWLAWDGTAWADGGTTLFNGLEEINENLDSFPFSDPATSDKSLTVRAQLVASADLLAVPTLGTVFAGVVYDPPKTTEDLKRTFALLARNTLRPALLFKMKMPAPGGTSLPIQHKFTITDVTSVFDLISDPTRQTNLFLSVAANVLTLSAPVTTGNTVEVLFRSSVQSVVHADEDFVRANMPFYLIEADSVEEMKEVNYGEEDVIVNTAKNLAKRFPWPVYYRAEVVIRAVAASELQMLAMTDAVEKRLMPGPPPRTTFARSEAIGEVLEIVDRDVFTPRSVARRGQHEGTARLVVQGKTWSETPTETQLAKTLDLDVLDQNLTVPSTRKRLSGQVTANTTLYLALDEMAGVPQDQISANKARRFNGGWLEDAFGRALDVRTEAVGGQFVDMGTDAAYHGVAGNEYTWDVLLQLRRQAAGVLLSKTPDGGGSQPAMTTDDSTIWIEFAVLGGTYTAHVRGRLAGGPVFDLQNTSFEVFPGQLLHVKVVYDGDKTVMADRQTLIMNGTTVATADVGTGEDLANTGVEPLFVGKDQKPRFLDAVIYEVKIEKDIITAPVIPVLGQN